MLTWLQGKKTYILVAVGAITIIVQWLTGDVSVMDFIMSTQFKELIAILGIGTLRAGVSNTK